MRTIFANIIKNKIIKNKIIGNKSIANSLLIKFNNYCNKYCRRMEDIANVDIDSGRFKYVLIKIIDTKNNCHKYIVRGYSWAAYHGDIVDQLEPHIKANKLSFDCVGGGRMEHNIDNKSIKVYGYSQGFGKADHSITCQLLKQHYSDYQSIGWSDEGY